MRRNLQNNRRGKRSIEQSDNVDRWLVSYADFITLLFAFFVVMYAISSINEGKYRVLSDTLVAAFKTPPKSPQPIQIGKPVEESVGAPQTQGIPKPIKVEPVQIDKQAQVMASIAKQVSQSLKPLIDKDLIKVTHNKLWVEVEINTSILFSSGSAELEIEANTPLQKLASVLKSLPNHIDVEGHTDDLPINNKIYPSNWELSASRAASVVHLFTKQGVAPNRLAAIGFGEFQPVAGNDSVIGRRQNRRVKVVILADKNARRVNMIDNAAEPAGETQ